MHQQTPDRAQLSAQDAFLFLKEAAPLLEGSGFGVMVPGWWQGRSARLQARARAKGKGPGPNAKSLLNFDALVSFNWELTLGGAPIDRAEFERLAALKQPLVQLRGQWVVLDPDQIGQALKFFERRDGELALADALQLGLGADGQALPAGVEYRRPGGRRLAQGSAGAAERCPNDRAAAAAEGAARRAAALPGARRSPGWRSCAGLGWARVWRTIWDWEKRFRRSPCCSTSASAWA